MKKRLLITSIVMMLVVAVALSTATYAWFTTNARVDANQVTLTAATNTAESLGISWTDGNYGTEIDATISGNFAPALPTELTTDTTTIGAAVDTHNIEFYTASATPGTDDPTNSLYLKGKMVFETAGQETTPYTWTDGNHTSFFVKNLSPANAINKQINITATITDVNTEDTIDAAALVRVAVFKKVADGYKLLGVLANQEAYTYTAVAQGDALTAADGTYFKKYLGKYVPAYSGTAQQVTDGLKDYYVGEGVENTGATTAGLNEFFTRTNTPTNAMAARGEIVQNGIVNNVGAQACVTSIDITEGAGLAADTAIELKIVVWEDAVALGDAEGGLQTSVALAFVPGTAIGA